MFGILMESFYTNNCFKKRETRPLQRFLLACYLLGHRYRNTGGGGKFLFTNKNIVDKSL
jgi:hypothetical protein